MNSTRTPSLLDASPPPASPGRATRPAKPTAKAGHHRTRGRKRGAKPSKHLAPGGDAFFGLRGSRATRDLRGALARLHGPSRVGALMDCVRDLALAHWRLRPADLRDLDRDVDPDWCLREDMVAYVDRSAGTLREVPGHFGWLKALGMTYLHFMPCLQPRPGPSDGGYAAMDYRPADPRLGTIDDLEGLARAAGAEGMPVCVDLVV